MARKSSGREYAKKFADGGPVDEPEGSYAGMIPDALEKVWGYIPSAADIAVTGKLSATPEEYDKARAKKDAEIARRRKKAK